MTVEEVTVVHVAEEEVVASSSSKVEIVVEEDKEKEKEDLSNGANGRTVKEDTDVDGDVDGSYVFVNGNDAENGDPVESDLEKNGNGIGGEDGEVENLETKGEVKSKPDLVKDLEREDESCIGIVDQDNKESMELCHVEGPVDEQKTGDLVEIGPDSAINAEDGVSETSRADENGVSESAKDGSANDIAKHTVSEAAVVDSIAKQSDEVSSVSVSDSNGSANDSVEDNVLDSGSKENEDSEMAVADDGDCNGDGLANDSAKDTVSESAVDTRNGENGVFELPVSDDGVPTVSVSDSNLDFLPNVSAKDTVSEAVLVDSRPGAEQNDGVPVSVSVSGNLSGSNGVGLPVAADTVEADSSGPVPNGNGDRPEQNGFFEIPETVLPDAVSGIPETVLPDAVSGNESVKGGENLTAANEFGLDLEHNTEQDLLSESDTHLEKETGSGSFSDECGEALQTVLINDSVDTSLNPQQGQSSEIVVESAPSLITNDENVASADFVESSSSRVTLNNVSVEIDISSTVTLNNVSVESSISDTTAETLPPYSVDDENSRGGSDSHHVENSEVQSGSVDDEKVETEVIKSDENSRGGLDSHHVENLNSEVDIKVHSGFVDDDSKSSCVTNGLKLETKIRSDSIVSEDAEVSKGLAECDSIELVTVGDTDEKLAVADVQNDSSLVAPLSNDEKAPAHESEVLDCDDVQNDSSLVAPLRNDEKVPVHESRVSDCDTNDNEQSCVLIKGGIQFGSLVTCQEPEGRLDEVERKRPFYFLIRVPRYDDENLKEKIRLAQIRVDEKTQIRDAIRIEMQSKRAICKEYGDKFDAAISQERAARDLHRSKRQEIESIQSVINIEDIDVQIRNMEHMIQHETMPLKDEKQFIHQIKQFKQNRERLSSNMGRQDGVQKGLDQKDQIKERLKSLKKEADQLKVNLLKAEAVTKAAKKEYHEETEKLNKLLSQFKAADDIRQEAYAQLRSLKKQSYEKNKYFWQYRDDAKAANDLAFKGDREALENLCVNQVEKLMDLWNNNDEFRKEYIRCNVRSTLRRLRTLDGRALGPDEEPPVIPQIVSERVAKDHIVSGSTSEERTREKVALVKAETKNDKHEAKAVEQKNQTSKSEKSVKSVVPPASGSSSTTSSIRDKIEEAGEEKPKITKEEDEVARKAEELRKEEEAAKSREQQRLEEIAKAKEALERKKRIAEKAEARAAQRAQKEAEQKEKEREKRAKKKERRKVAAAAVGDASVTDEVESAPTSQTPAETPKESENKEKPVTVAKRSQKPSQFTKQAKAKSVPLPLRNRGKRKMQPWMWVLLTSLVILALFLVGNYNFSFNFGLLQRFNF